MLELSIAGRWVGDNHPVMIVAELSANHNQDKSVALKTIEAAKHAGADAIKLQTYTPDGMTLDLKQAPFVIEQDSLWDGCTLYELYQQAQTPWQWHQELFDRARELGLIVFSSPFDLDAVSFLEDLAAPAYKIASFEIGDHALIAAAAQTQKPVIMSTGIATEQEIDEAVAVCRQAGNDQVILLKCTSAYPARADEAHLRHIPWLKNRWDCLVGVSDHSQDLAVPGTAVALGACVVEKHMILDRALGGPDAAFSLNPSEFRLMVDHVRSVEKALGDPSYKLSDRAQKNRFFGRSLFVTQDIAQGECLTQDNVKSLRPAVGLAPKYLPKVIGAKAARNLSKGTPLREEDLDL